MKWKFKFLAALAPVIMLILCPPLIVKAAYVDVPDDALGGEVRKAVEYGLMNGFSDAVFGYSVPMTRAQFVTVLDRMLLSDEAGSPLSEAMELPASLSDVYRASLSRAVTCGVADSSAPFRAEDPVTREEMAEMLVRALGLNDAALSLSSSLTSAPVSYAVPFQDLPKGKEGYAVIAYAIGMVKDASQTAFHPDEPVTRAQAAAMLTRVYEKLHQQTDFRHGFLPADAQINSETQMDAVSLEWGRMTWSATSARLLTTIPNDYKSVVETLDGCGAKLHLSVFMGASDGVWELLADENKSARTQAIQQILHELTASYSALGRNPYSGVTIDFEGLHQEQADAFVAFLSELKDALSPIGKGLYVCVEPYVSDGHWDDGYDCRAIAAVADKLILMAYGYGTENLNNFLGTEAYQNEAPAPADKVCLSLLHLAAAVPDMSRTLLGVRFRPTAWKIGANEKLISGAPVSVSSDALEQYLRFPGVRTAWSFEERTPYAIYDASAGERYFVWYENAKSVRKKAEIARLLGVTGVSYSPLGDIPSDLL